MCYLMPPSYPVSASRNYLFIYLIKLVLINFSHCSKAWQLNENFSSHMVSSFLGVKLVGIYAYTCNSVTKKIELRNINIIKMINLE